MNKLIYRFAAVLLVPCLLADPVAASGMHGVFTDPVHSSRPSRLCFSDQAIVAALVVAIFHPRTFHPEVSAALQSSAASFMPAVGHPTLWLTGSALVALGFAVYRSKDSLWTRLGDGIRAVIKHPVVQPLVKFLVLLILLIPFGAFLLYVAVARPAFIIHFRSWLTSVGTFDPIAHLPDWNPWADLGAGFAFFGGQVAGLDRFGWAAVLISSLWIPFVARSYIVHGLRRSHLWSLSVGIGSLIAISLMTGLGLGDSLLILLIAVGGFAAATRLYAFDRTAYFTFNLEPKLYILRVLHAIGLALLIGLPSAILWNHPHSLPNWHPWSGLVAGAAAGSAFTADQFAGLDRYGWATVLIMSLGIPSVARSFSVRGLRWTNLAGIVVGLGSLIALMQMGGVGLGGVLLFLLIASLGFAAAVWSWHFDRPVTDTWQLEWKLYRLRAIHGLALALLIGFPSMLAWNHLHPQAPRTEQVVPAASPVRQPVEPPVASPASPPAPPMAPNLPKTSPIPKEADTAKPPKATAASPVPDAPFKLSDAVRGADLPPPPSTVKPAPEPVPPPATPAPAPKPAPELPDFHHRLYGQEVEPAGEQVDVPYKVGTSAYTFTFSNADFVVLYLNPAKTALFNFKMQDGKSFNIGGDKLEAPAGSTFLEFDFRRSAHEGTATVTVNGGAKDLHILFQAYKIKTPSPAASLWRGVSRFVLARFDQKSEDSPESIDAIPRLETQGQRQYFVAEAMVDKKFLHAGSPFSVDIVVLPNESGGADLTYFTLHLIAPNNEDVWLKFNLEGAIWKTSPLLKPVTGTVQKLLEMIKVGRTAGTTGQGETKDAVLILLEIAKLPKVLTDGFHFTFTAPPDTRSWVTIGKTPALSHPAGASLPVPVERSRKAVLIAA